VSESKPLWKDNCVGKHVDPLHEASGRVADQLAVAMKGDSAEVVELAKRD
jgi:hypothetical protein